MTSSPVERPPFHLAFPVRDLETTRAFYVDRLGCREGRSAETWVDFDLFGHQLSTHVVEAASRTSGHHNAVDGDQVPLPHFGVVLTIERFEELESRLRASGTEFVIEPRVRFEGQPGEQHTMFLRDPSGNALEFKAFRDAAQLFET